MEWQVSGVGLAIVRQAEKSAPERTIASIFLRVLVVWTVLFSAGAAVSVMKLESEPGQAVAASISGPVALSCMHMRWCSKPIQRHYIDKYPIVAVVEHSV